MRVLDPMIRSRRMRWVDLVAAAAVAAALVYFACRGAHLQWDLKVYLAAARAALDGLDPYRLDDLARAAGRPVALPYLYPLVALVPFAALAQVPGALAAAAWMGLKVVLLAGLVAVWRTRFLPHVPWCALALVALFGSNAAALWDLRAGNVALVEAALLWSGFACYAAGRRRAFAALVVGAAVFKLAPAAFLLLLLVPTASAPARPRLFAAALAVLVALVLGPPAVAGLVSAAGAPASGFLSNLPADFLVGDANPSSYALLESLGRAWIADGAARARLVLITWGAWVLVLIAASAHWLRAAWRAQDPVRWVMGATVLYLLVAPRPMAYGFAIAGAPLLFFAPGVFRRGAGAVVFAGLVSAQGLAAAASEPWSGAFGMYGAFFALAGIWGVTLLEPAQPAHARSADSSLQDARSRAAPSARAAA